MTSSGAENHRSNFMQSIGVACKLRFAWACVTLKYAGLGGHTCS